MTGSDVGGREEEGAGELRDRGEGVKYRGTGALSVREVRPNDTR